MEEPSHVIEVLKRTQLALQARDAQQLRALSDQTIHCASYVQDSGSITIAVMVYALSKLIERNDQARIKNWNTFVRKFNAWIDLAIKTIKEKENEEYEVYLEQARKSLVFVSGNLKPYIQEVFLKASINKASRIYEHGISSGKTAQLLGITQWELSEYLGQRKTDETTYSTINIKQRARTALDFFS